MGGLAPSGRWCRRGGRRSGHGDPERQDRRTPQPPRLMWRRDPEESGASRSWSTCTRTTASLLLRGLTLSLLLGVTCASGISVWLWAVRVSLAYLSVRPFVT